MGEPDWLNDMKLLLKILCRISLECPMIAVAFSGSFGWNRVNIFQFSKVGQDFMHASSQYRDVKIDSPL